MAFRAFTVTFNTNKLFGFAQYPETVRDLAIKDSTRETPWTLFGKMLKENNATCDLEIRPGNLTLDAANALIVSARNLGINTLPSYSLVDDAFPEPGDTTGIVATKPSLQTRVPFLGDDALAHFKTLFVSDAYRPTQKHDLSTSDMLGFMFNSMASKENAWSNSAVYDARQRKVAIHTVTGPQELTMTAFLDAVTPWFVDNVINCLKCIVHDSDVDDGERAEAYHCLHKLLTVVGVHSNSIVTVADVITGRQKKYKTTDRTQTRDCIKAVMLKDNIKVTFEKLRRIYFKPHPKTPDAKKYIKKLNDIKEANGDNDWLKDLRGYTNPEFWKL